MKISSATLAGLRTTYNTSFQKGFDGVDPEADKIATTVRSSSKSNTYGWLGQFPTVRKWIGDRHINNLSEHGYTIYNDPYEDTVGVDRMDILNDELGLYPAMFEDLGVEAKEHKERQVFNQLLSGFDTECYDGQFFFDTDHPVKDEDGNIQTVSNTGGGTGDPWFLLCTNRPLKPIIWQQRLDWGFVAMDNPNDESVFRRAEFQYGIDSASGVGYGFWQMAFGSKQALTPASYQAARTALKSMTGDGGRKLGLKPNLLVVGATNEGAALDIVKTKTLATGGGNKWAGTADLLVSSWI